jgi:hypothetical protein
VVGAAPDHVGIPLAVAGQRAYLGAMDLILWIIAVVLVISGIVALVRGEIIWGVVLIVIGLLVGPGGVSIFT